MRRTQTSLMCGAFLLAMLLASSGCVEKMMLPSDLLIFMGKASGVFGCQGCRPEDNKGENDGENLLSAENTTTVEGETAAEGEGESKTEGEGESASEGEAKTVGIALAPLVDETPGEGEASIEGEAVRSVNHTGNLVILLPGDVPLALMHIPAYPFLMGAYPGEQEGAANETPRHQVMMTQAFYMGKYEITQQQWLALMGAWPDKTPNTEHGVGDAYPAYYISWNNAQDFATALNAHIAASGQGPGTVRLPSEAEWEYACRAGTNTRFYWGDDPNYMEIDQYAWYDDNNEPNGAKPVGGKQPNAFGLFDMSGNVWEWCDDDWHESYVGAPQNGTPWRDHRRSGSRVVRGCSWADDIAYCRSAGRGAMVPDIHHLNLGFRIVLDK